ncbi:unknown protein [Desulfotalea psychrophila LSv54]|uniref:Uncharacterized protein n=2 Tax=Desulfotalea psychrophila TaxID=84980 RepID=Q6AMB1_DESPS|nr:unknown protein [Desulfotalea psychrophila LSv54]
MEMICHHDLRQDATGESMSTLFQRYPFKGKALGWLLVSTLLLAWNQIAQAGTVDFSGQASTWLIASENSSQFGMQYIPELSWQKALTENYKLSAEAAINAQWAKHLGGGSQEDATLDPYRLWLRFAANQYELRAGLQKISFGSATLLRPLRWFDTLDPRDPQQLTDGVYGLLGRYYFPNNANIWLWLLYGNHDLKGWETMPTEKRRVEYGGRAQLTLLAGEIALSYDHRWVNGKDFFSQTTGQTLPIFAEDRLGLDGKWDLGAGLWFEASLTRQDLEAVELPYQRLLTVGMDYTFDLGNGLHVLGEHLEGRWSKKSFGNEKRQAISALSVTYPLGILDTLVAINYYDWQESYWSPFITWQRTYDEWQLNVSLFSNPEQPLTSQDQATNNSFAGKGMQILLVFNH